VLIKVVGRAVDLCWVRVLGLGVLVGRRIGRVPQVLLVGAGWWGQPAGRGRAASRRNAVARSKAHGHCSAMRSRVVRAVRAATCSNRWRSFFGSAVARSPCRSRSWVQASRSMPVRASCSQAWLMAKTRDGNRPKPVSLPVRMRSSTRLHDHPGHAQLPQPVGQDQQPAGHRLVGGDLLPSAGPSCPGPEPAHSRSARPCPRLPPPPAG
jgi:hypothetical protein